MTRCDSEGVPTLVQRLRLVEDRSAVEADYFDGTYKRLDTRVPIPLREFMPIFDWKLRDLVEHENHMFWLQAEADAERAWRHEKRGAA